MPPSFSRTSSPEYCIAETLDVALLEAPTVMACGAVATIMQGFTTVHFRIVLSDSGNADHIICSRNTGWNTFCHLLLLDAHKLYVRSHVVEPRVYTHD